MERSNAVAVPLVFVAIVFVLGAVSSFAGRGWDGVVFLGAGLAGTSYAAWRLAHPGWREDAFWTRHPRVGAWIDGRFLPRSLEKRWGNRRVDRINDLIALAFGIAAVGIGVAFLT
jgi:hypothetical protein